MKETILPSYSFYIIYSTSETLLIGLHVLIGRATDKGNKKAEKTVISANLFLVESRND